LEQLLEPVNGFIILDLHNLYCQLRNFDLAFDEMISLYPLERVREIHISGGSWDESATNPSRSVRRDTHDDAVPPDVFQLLEMTIPRCPHLKYVVLEQLGNGLETTASRSSFHHDFLQMELIVREYNSEDNVAPMETFLPSSPLLTGIVVEDVMLYEQQLELSSILESSASYEEAMRLLGRSSLARSDWRIEEWEPYMIETALKIAQKWKK